MSNANPSPVRVGMNATLRGQRYRVAGRVVLSMDDEGTPYYWNEFNLVAMDGTSATLVFEDDETGGTWRLFTLFQPQFPLTATEAAACQVGQQVNLDGRPIRITLVDQSKVESIEGVAPEGVEVGDRAHYFNAGRAGAMIVVSWTGDEVEFYQGEDLPAFEVAAAFGLPDTRFQSASRAGTTWENLNRVNTWFTDNRWLRALVGILMVATVLGVTRCRTQGRVPARVATPAAPLALQDKFLVQDLPCVITEHHVVEIDRVRQPFGRHEYVTSGVGGPHLLICGLDPKSAEWLLLKPTALAEPLTPYRAAAMRVGDFIAWNDPTARITELFRTRYVQRESAETPGTLPDVRFGFIARSGSDWILARWTENQAWVYSGRTVQAKEIKAEAERLRNAR